MLTDGRRQAAAVEITKDYIAEHLGIVAISRSCPFPRSPSVDEMATREGKRADRAIKKTSNLIFLAPSTKLSREIFIDREANVPLRAAFARSFLLPSVSPSRRPLELVPFLAGYLSFDSNFARQILAESWDTVESFRWRN